MEREAATPVTESPPALVCFLFSRSSSKDSLVKSAIRSHAQETALEFLKLLFYAGVHIAHFCFNQTPAATDGSIFDQLQGASSCQTVKMLGDVREDVRVKMNSGLRAIMNAP